MENHRVLLRHRQGLAAWLFVQRSLYLSRCSQLLRIFLLCQEAAGRERGMLVLTPLGVIALKRNPVGQPGGEGGTVGAAEPCGNQCLCRWEQGSKWLVEPRFQVAVCRGACRSCIFDTVGYKWPIFTSAYIMYIIPSLPSSLSDVLCIDLSFTLQLHFALLHFNDI